MSGSSKHFVWGHININVTNLERSIAFYETLGFSVFSDGVAYLGLTRSQSHPVATKLQAALGIDKQYSARACIMQLGEGFPKLDLTEMSDAVGSDAVSNDQIGLVRICLGTRELAEDYENLKGRGVEFVSPPVACEDRMADIAICRDPDGAMIELIQIYPERWPSR